MENFVEYCKNYIIDTLPEYEDQETYGADLCGLIMESPNADGTLTYSTQEAMNYIKEWWYDCAEFWDYAIMNFGEDYVAKSLNVFDNPEAFMVVMVYEGVGSLLNRVSVVDENWNDKLELTPEVVETILAEVEQMNSIEW